MNSYRLTFSISWILILIFTYASGLKLWAYMQSKAGLDFFPFVGDYHELVFWGLQTVQLMIAGTLSFCRTRLLGMYAAFFLLASLSTYLYVLLHYADHIPCICTGIIPGISWNGHMWFTVGLDILAGVGIALLPKEIHAHG